MAVIRTCSLGEWRVGLLDGARGGVSVRVSMARGTRKGGLKLGGSLALALSFQVLFNSALIFRPALRGSNVA